jgi:hypothetical protein
MHGNSLLDLSTAFRIGIVLSRKLTRIGFRRILERPFGGGAFGSFIVKETPEPEEPEEDLDDLDWSCSCFNSSHILRYFLIKSASAFLYWSDDK